MLPEPMDLADEEARRFVAVLLKSALVLSQDVARLIRDFCQDNPEASARSAINLSTFLIANKVLTPWQARRLHDGRFKGFFMDRYLLLEQLGATQRYSTYMARDMLTSRRVQLAVWPSADRRANYRVLKEMEE